jgi:hypothetical protein
LTSAVVTLTYKVDALGMQVLNRYTVSKLIKFNTVL